MDSKKAFDNISFSLLFMVKRQFGNLGSILHFVQKMYASPTACLVTPDFIFADIPLTKGTWQGCLLSPLLFNITIKPLSHLLNSD